ncbi:MAG: hypothetical protein ACRC10_06225 [Thermoguttaceae bacterium]
MKHIRLIPLSKLYYLFCLFAIVGTCTLLQAQIFRVPSQSPSRLRHALASSERVSPQGPVQNMSKWTTKEGETSKGARDSDRLAYYLDPDVLNRDELVEVIRDACEKAKTSFQVPSESQLKNVRAKLKQTVNLLDKELKKYSDQEKAETWRKLIGLQELKQMLSQPKDFSSDILTGTLHVLLVSPCLFDQVLFGSLKNELRQYLALEYVIQNEDYVESFAQLCDEIPVFVDCYLDGDRPEYGPPLADSVRWLDDLGVISQETRELVAVLKKLLARPNCFFSASAKFLNGGYRQEYVEDVEVRENIFGTMLTGKGVVESQTVALLQPNLQRGELQIQIDSAIKTNTVGRKGRVRILNENTGTLLSYKPMYFGANGISYGPTRTTGNIHYETQRLDIYTCQLLQPIIRNQTLQRKPTTEREATRRTEQRMNKRIDARADERISLLNERFQEKIRQPLLEVGYFPTIWQFYSNEAELNGVLLIGDSSQLSTATLPPEKSSDVDLSVQIHQSALTNTCSFGLGGQRIEEKELFEHLREQFPEWTGTLERDTQDTENPSLTITFAQKSPISFVFLDQCLSVIIHADRFEQEGRDYPGLDITIKYNVKTVTVEEDGRLVNRVVFELADVPKVYPPGFDPNSGEKIAGRAQIIRGVVTRRLDKALKKSWTLEPIELGEQWKGRGVLEPASVSCENGWFSLTWTWNEQP